jgi:hypothetical protein
MLDILKNRSSRERSSLGLGLLLVVVGTFLGLWSLYCVATYEKTDGTARYVGIAQTSPGKHRGGSKYTISYQGVDGKGHSINAVTLGFLGMGYDDGEKVPILYPKSSPDSGIRGTFLNLWLWTLILIPIGLIIGWDGVRRSNDDDDNYEEESNLSAEELIARSKKKKKQRKD